MTSILKIIFFVLVIFLLSFLPLLAAQLNSAFELQCLKGLDGVIIDDFIVNYDSISPAQQYPDIAKDALGNFVITWQDWRNGNWDIYAQRYDPLGNPLSSNFKVNDDSGASVQYNPAITLNGTKNSVISWQDNRNGNYDIYAQRLDSLGIPLGSNFKVNDDTGSAEQSYPAIASDSSGNFVITWQDMHNGNYDIYAQRYNSMGFPLGLNFRVNDDTGSKSQLGPSVSMNGSGQFTVAWQDYRNGNYDIYAQRYDSSGNPIGYNFRVNDDTGTADQSSPAIAMDVFGNFVIVWTDSRNTFSDIYAQRYNSSGNAIGFNFRVNDPWVATYEEHPDIAMNDSGNFVITWDFYWYDIGYRFIYAQRYGSSGTPLGTNFKVNDLLESTWLHFPAIAMDDSNKFVITWQDLRNGNWDIYAQRYKPSGTYFYSNFKVNDNTRSPSSSDQEYPDISTDYFGNFVITWVDNRNGNSDIYAQRYSSLGMPLGLNFKVNDDATGAPQGHPAIAVDSTGNFVISWHDCRNGRPDEYGNWYPSYIYAQRYDSSGVALGSNFKMSDVSGPASQYNPAVAIDKTGDFIITWNDFRSNISADIYAQRYGFSGAPLGSNFKVSNTLSGAFPAVAMNVSGDFIIAWIEELGGNAKIYGQRYDSTGNPLGSNFKVNNFQGWATHTYPDVAMDDLGNFVITWRAWFLDPSNYDIYAQRYNSSGISQDSNFKVNGDSSTHSQYAPSIAMLGSGNFIITWFDGRNYNWDIYAQRYDSYGNAVSNNYLINNPQFASFAQSYPAIAANNSRVYFAWMDNRRGKGWDIYAKVVDWNWTKVGENENAGLPNSFELGQNYPNPFNPATTIPFRAGSLEHVAGSPIRTTLKIYNILGQKVRTLVDEDKAPGNYKVIWDGKDDSDKEVASGIYFYQLKTRDYTETRKMILLR